MKKVLMTGNEAVGEAAIRAGCRFYAGYPITPQNELTAYMAKRMLEVGGTFIQSESELAAISMVFGASVAGARSMTSSSSPGISLKQEGISYLAGCELPAVIVNVMRGAPGLGNISPAQSDYFQATRGGGHGDYRQIVFAPASVQEIFDLTPYAFDLADAYRTPVMILGDGMLGQMMEPVSLEKPANQKPVNPTNGAACFASGGVNSGKRSKPWALTGCKGRKPNIIKSLYLEEGTLEELNRKLQRRYAEIKRKFVLYETLNTRNADIVLIGYGSVSRICRKVVDKAKHSGIKIGLLRPITLWPFPERVIARLTKQTKKFLVVEMSMGQMIEDVKLAVNGKAYVDFYGRSGGGIPEEKAILDKVKRLLGKKQKPQN